MSEIDIAISRQLWWTQNLRSRSWAVPYAKKKRVKDAAHITFRSLITPADSRARHTGRCT